MSGQERKPDADATPLSDDELAVFDELAQQLGSPAKGRISLRVRFLNMPPIRATFISVFVTALLLFACVPLAQITPFAAVVAWLAAVGVCVAAWPSWQAAASRVSSTASRTMRQR